MVSKKQLQALLFATAAHALQVRKYSGDFYIVHPLEVRQILVENGVDDEEMLIAALLHDVPEDTEYTHEDILEFFGAAVAELVVELTDEKIEGNRAVRKEAARARLENASSRAQMVKCADFISNTRDIAARDPGFAKVYLQEKKTCLESFSEVTKRSQVFRVANHQIVMLQRGFEDVDS